MDDAALREECEDTLDKLDGHIGCTVTRYGSVVEARLARQKDIDIFLAFAKRQRAAGLREAAEMIGDVYDMDLIVDYGGAEYPSQVKMMAWCEARAKALEGKP